MIGWVLSALAVGYVCNLRNNNKRLDDENKKLKDCNALQNREYNDQLDYYSNRVRSYGRQLELYDRQVQSYDRQLNTCNKKLNNYSKKIVNYENQFKLLKDYDFVNGFAKDHNFRGAVDFFFYLAKNHDERFTSFGRFLDKVRHMRNSLAHAGIEYEIDENFLRKLRACKEVCIEYRYLSGNQKLRLN